MGREELIESTEVGVSTLPGLILLRVFLACVAHLLFSFLFVFASHKFLGVRLIRDDWTMHLEVGSYKQVMLM